MAEPLKISGILLRHSRKRTSDSSSSNSTLPAGPSRPAASWRNTSTIWAMKISRPSAGCPMEPVPTAVEPWWPSPVVIWSWETTVESVTSSPSIFSGMNCRKRSRRRFEPTCVAGPVNRATPPPLPKRWSPRSWESCAFVPAIDPKNSSPIRSWMTCPQRREPQPPWNASSRSVKS